MALGLEYGAPLFKAIYGRCGNVAGMWREMAITDRNRQTMNISELTDRLTEELKAVIERYEREWYLDIDYNIDLDFRSRTNGYIS